MAIVTFMSDYGLEDHYVAAVKGIMLSRNPSLQIVDISHQIQAFDLSHASYVLAHSFHHFPQGTVHLVSVDTADRKQKRIIAMKLEGHYFVGRDSGLFSILSERSPEMIVELSATTSTFPARDQLAMVAARLASGEHLTDLGSPITDDTRLIARQPKVTKREIVGNIIRIDGYGNLITNIVKTDFDKMRELNGQAVFEVQFGRERATEFQQSYDDADPGEIYLIFNSDQKLQIGINKGHAAELLGLKFDSPVYIEFEV